MEGALWLRIDGVGFSAGTYGIRRIQAKTVNGLHNFPRPLRMRDGRVMSSC